MIRLHVAEPLATDAHIHLGHEQSHYLSSVMRRQPGDALLLFNGRDGEWLGIVLDVRKKGVVLQVKEKVREQVAAPDLELVVALVKRARLETIVEKAAELGSDVTINGVDASSSLMIMTLGAGNGDTVEVAGDDQAAVDTIAALVEQDLDA